MTESSHDNVQTSTFKDLLGSWKHDIHLLVIDIEIRFFKNKDKYQDAIVIPLAQILKIFAYKGSELNFSKQTYNLSFCIAIVFNELPLGDIWFYHHERCPLSVIVGMETINHFPCSNRWIYFYFYSWTGSRSLPYASFSSLKYSPLSPPRYPSTSDSNTSLLTITQLQSQTPEWLGLKTTCGSTRESFRRCLGGARGSKNSISKSG